MSWNFLLPLPVNCISTTGPRLGSRSARVPESFRSLPVTSGGPFGLSGSYLKRYHVLLVGVALTPGHTTASVPQEMTAVFFGTPKTTYDGFFFALAFAFAFAFAFGGAAWSERELDGEPCSERCVIWSFFAAFGANSASRVVAGPAITFFDVLSRRYHSPAPFCLTSAC